MFLQWERWVIEPPELIAATLTSPFASCVNMAPVLVVVGIHNAAIVPVASSFGDRT